jgi:hypothetical protein
MKNTVKQTAMYIGMLIGNAAPALAADVAREDNSNLFVWGFLAFCALIVIAQLIPAITMMLGVVRGVKNTTAEPVAVEEASKQ